VKHKEKTAEEMVDENKEGARKLKTMAKKTRYKKLIITANALVPKGAVQEKAVFKGIEFGQLKQLTNIVKDDNNQTMYSIWYPLNKVDAHGDFVDSPTVLEDAAIDFMKSGEKSIKILHEGNFTDGAVVKELWIVKTGDPIFTNPDLVGSLAGGIKFLDAELYNKCKSENWETSIEGQAEEEIVEKSMIEELKEFIKNLFAKSLNNAYIKEEPQVKVEERKEVDMTPDEVKAMIAEAMTALKTEIMTELKPEKPAEEMPVEDEKPAEPMPDPEKEELKKTVEKLKAELDKEVKKSVQFKQVEKSEPESVRYGVLGEYK